MCKFYCSCLYFSEIVKFVIVHESCLGFDLGNGTYKAL